MSTNLKKIIESFNPFSDIEFKTWTQVTPENSYKIEELRQKGFLQYRYKSKTNENKEVNSQEYVRLNPDRYSIKKREKIERKGGIIKLIDRIVNLPV